ncbi:MAG: glycosyltransferase family 4 protein [Ignavibacteria bacterium]
MTLTVLHSESSLGWGGQENRILNEMLGLRALGHRALVVCQPGARLAQRAREAGFEAFEVRMRNALDLPAVLRLRRLMRAQGVQVVNTHSGRDTQLAGMAARSLGSKRPRVVRTRHLALPITSRFGYAVLPDQVVTVSAFVRELLIGAGVPGERITSVPTGIDLGRWNADPAGGTLRRELGLPDDAPLIGTVAILRRKKGHAELLEALPAVFDRFPQAHAVFAGDGPQKENLERLIAEKGLGDQVHLLGLRRDVANVLQSLDVFVLPTHQEALGTAFVEAGVMGLPSVASRVDGVPEVIVDGENGLLVPVCDSSAIAAALIRLLDDPALRRRLGENARKRASERFSREAMVEGMVAVYRRLLDAA